METPPEVSQLSRKEYLAKMRWRYGQRGREGKSRLLDEFCDVCGYDRKHAIKLLNAKPFATKGKAGRKPVYAKEVAAIIKPIWLSSEQPCGKRLKELLPLWLPHYERREGALSKVLRRSVLAASAATLDRLLSPYRSAHPKRWRAPKPGTLIKAQVPVRTDNADIHEPGSIEADSVAHCGGSLLGDLVWSVNLTDIVSQWTQTCAVWNKGQHGVVQAIALMEPALPITLRAVDIDNGSEPERSGDSQPQAARRASTARQFLNWHLKAYLSERKDKPAVQLTRSRPYHKNDNAHIEQKNWTHVRQLIGYDRLGHEACVAALNAVYDDWNLLQNLFCPTMKLKEKKREGGKYRKTYHAAQTPAERLLAWSGLSQEKRAWIKRMQREQDPFELHQRVESKLRALWKIVHDAQRDEAPEQDTAATEGGGGERFGAVDPSVPVSLRSTSTPRSTAPKTSCSVKRSLTLTPVSSVVRQPSLP